MVWLDVLYVHFKAFLRLEVYLGIVYANSLVGVLPFVSFV